MPATVVLLHRLPDGSFHYDWMLDMEGGGEGGGEGRGEGWGGLLVTFRMERAVHEQRPPAAWAAERLADHRRIYLEYEGPLSGDRGEVRRVAKGTFEGGLSVDGSSLSVRAAFGAGSVLIRGSRGSGGLWRMEVGGMVVGEVGEGVGEGPSCG